MRQTKSFTLEDLRGDQQIIIYGAGRYGEIALRGLQSMNLQPAYFADRALAGKRYLGVDVIAPDELSRHKDDAVLIASYNGFSEMLAALQALGCRFYYDICTLMELDYDRSVLSEYALEEIGSPHKYLNVVNAGGHGLVITHCELVLTERCSLRCRDCADLMQYYQHPEDLNADELISSFSRFIDTIDMLVELRLLGGEPFLYRNIDQVLKAFSGCEKIASIGVYTNSTIIPRNDVIESLKNEKIYVHMSDYGAVSRNVRQLEELFKKHQIRHYVHPYDKWYDFGGLEKRSYTPAEKSSVYHTCFSAKCHTFYRGKLYVCPRAAHGERLGAFVNPSGEVVDYTGGGYGAEEKRRELAVWLKERADIVACDYCNGMGSRCATVDAAIQA